MVIFFMPAALPDTKFSPF